MAFNISGIEIDVLDYADKDKTASELEQYTSRMIAAVVSQSGCTVGDAKNALIRQFHVGTLTKPPRGGNTESGLISRAASYHRRAATTNYILGKKSVAIEHWHLCKLLQLMHVAGVTQGLRTRLHEVNDSNEINSSNEIKRALSELGKKGARAMLANSAKQAAKAKAHELWKDWQAGRAIHKSGAAFARYVVQQLPAIESEESVKRWAREWAAEAKATTEPAK